MNKTIYRKVENHNRTYRIQTTVKNSCLSFIIIEQKKDEVNAYKSETILEQNLKKQASCLNIGIEDYFKKLIRFFGSSDQNGFSFDENSFTILESVNSNLQAKIFHCDIIRVDEFSNFIGNFIDTLHEEKYELEISRKNLSEECEILQKKISEYKNKLNELVERKNLDDQAMLSNFVLLLNEKKKRIQHLTELLEAYRLNPSLASPAEVNVQIKKKKKQNVIKLEQPKIEVNVSDSYSDENYNTDDEFEAKKPVDVKVEEQVIENKYEDIFDESPSKVIPNLPDMSVMNKTDVNLSLLTSCSKNTETNSIEKRPKKEMNSLEINSNDVPMVEISTQDWLDGI